MIDDCSVSDLRQVSGFLLIPPFPPSIKLTATKKITEILLKVVLNTIILTLHCNTNSVYKQYMYKCDYFFSNCSRPFNFLTILLFMCVGI